MPGRVGSRPMVIRPVRNGSERRAGLQTQETSDFSACFGAQLLLRQITDQAVPINAPRADRLGHAKPTQEGDQSQRVLEGLHRG